MSDQIFTYAALALYFAGMLLIGYIAFRRTDDHEDYMLGGRNLPPWVAAISAGAADMSGWLVMGLPGAIYVSGLIEAWIAIGLTIGAYLNWLLVAPRLRAYTQVSRNSITVPSFFENRLRDSSRTLRVLAGLIILVFFTLYISSGMVAAGVFFESSFNGDYLFGMLLVGGITLLYTLFGGFLGASFTDVVQGLMMVIALIVVPVAAVIAIGGLGETGGLIAENAGAGHLALLGGEAVTGATMLAIVSALAWGLGYFGQPHIIVRFMALRTPQEAKSARRIGISWMVISMGGAVLSGLVGIAYMAQQGIDLDNAETVVLVMSQTLLPPFVAGLILAAVLAAIMSTISSQLVVCSSALVEDLYKVVKKDPPSQKRLVLLGRMAVLAVAIVAIVLAITPNDTILGLVSFAWAGFGAAFGPIILLSLFWRKLTTWGALTGMFVGAATVFIWKALNTGLYELLPAFVLATVAAVLVSLVTYRHNEEIQQEFTDTGTMLAVRPRADN
ncbi:sodium/proline symporter PutP [Microbacterium sp.]|uniref:sodium/proline symporter PutP n=1 Tax=Microbacterium sp. TaxID=51671 RepID=UPI0028122EA9|nr:sodium/proline symporter PutP [Microbacterium sp.]